MHAGIALGLDLFVTGMGNVRDVTPFLRTPKSAEFYVSGILRMTIDAFSHSPKSAEF
ncbi:MAG: hypothetical protein H6591_00885 [Flavobacteriales bacterium]|nr:hypothetical protein [Flavobacteriales bacterium]